MAFLSPEDYERIGHLEGDIEAAKADIANYTASHPIPDHPEEGATPEAIAAWEVEVEKSISHKPEKRHISNDCSKNSKIPSASNPFQFARALRN